MGRENGGKKIQGAPVLGRDFCWSLTTPLHAMSKMKLFAETNLRTCAYQGVRNSSFSENFAYVLNE